MHSLLPTLARVRDYESWCFEPSQPRKIISLEDMLKCILHVKRDLGPNLIHHCMDIEEGPRMHVTESRELLNRSR